jgi:hypothetical protein
MCRIALCFALIFVLWDIKSVFYAIWTPFDWLVGYTDPRKGKQDRLHGESRRDGGEGRGLGDSQKRDMLFSLVDGVL